MKALETNYNGILFRSRLEARWALLFDILKLNYVYEPECFVLSNGQKYTPDFYIEKYDMYIEIKPNFDWMKEKYHIGRYNLFEKQLVVLSGSYPNFNVNVDIDYYNDTGMGIVFCPNSKYEPLFFSGLDLGEEDFIENKKELNEVKNYRFWN